MHSYKKDKKLFEVYSQYTVKCKCGHSVTILNRTKKVICKWCGKTVYFDKKQEFKELLGKTMRCNNERKNDYEIHT